MTGCDSGVARPTADARARTVGGIVVALVVLGSCSGSDRDGGTVATVVVPTESITSIATDATLGSPATTQSSTLAPSTSSVSPTTARAEGELPSLPLPGFAFDIDSEFEVVRDLRGFSSAGGVLFAFTPPDTMLRIDPTGRTVESMELGIGPSVGGAPSWAVADDAMWLIGGAFRDQLIEIDTTTMTEVRRIGLEDDHSVAVATATAVWLMTAGAVRRFDVVSGTLEPPIELVVDPGAVAVGPDESIWVSLPVAAQVARVDPATGDVDTFDVAPGPGWIATDRSAVWVSHPPIASVSRLDPLTGDTIEVIDLDLSAGTVASAQTGALQAIDDGVWVFVSFPGSPHRNALALIDPSGFVVGARSIQFDSHTWEAVEGAIWVHRVDSGSIIRSSLDDFDSTPPTDEADLLPAVTTTTLTPSTTTMSSEVAAAERSLLAALDTVLDESVPAGDLGLEPQAEARRDLIDLAAAQTELRVEPRSFTIVNEAATTVFDVLVEGDTVVLPGVQLTWRRVDDRTWHLDPASFCALAAGVGITGCEP